MLSTCALPHSCLSVAPFVQAKKKYEQATQHAEVQQLQFDKASQDMNLTRAAVEKVRCAPPFAKVQKVYAILYFLNRLPLWNH